MFGKNYLKDQKGISLININLKDISKTFSDSNKKSAKVIALENINLKVEEGEFVCIVGPSGCGKSTLLKIIADIVQPTKGEIEKPAGIAFVFQSGELLPWLSVKENVGFGLKMKGQDSKKISKEVIKILELVGLEKFPDRFPRELSGGQRQRVGIARALAMEPQVLLLDEPFSALDTFTSDQLQQDLITIWQNFKPTILMVSHSLEEAVKLADRVVVMDQGKIKATVEILFPRPRNINQVGFLMAVNRIKRNFTN